MTVSAPTVYPDQYSCNGVLDEFDFNFSVAETTEVEVVLTDSDGNETVLTETTHYTISATNDDYSNGGTVTTVAIYGTGNTLTIRLAVPLTQEREFTENMTTLYEEFEAGLDKVTRIAQQNQEKISRCLSFPKSTLVDGEGAVPAPDSQKYLRWNLAETALENASLVALGDLSAHETNSQAHHRAALEIVIAAGVIDLTSYTDREYLSISSETGTSDDLSSITGLATGDIVILAPAVGHTITVKNGTGFIIASDFVMDSVYDRIVLQHIGSNNFVQLSRASNG